MTELRSVTFTESMSACMRTEIAATLAWSAGTRDRQGATRHFCVLTPLGRTFAARLEAALDGVGARVVRKTPIPRWSRVASFLYTRSGDARSGGGGSGNARSIDAFRVQKAWAYECLWQSRFPEDEAERWEFADEAAYLRLLERKYLVRGLFPSRTITVSTPGFRRRLRLHAFHLPDPGRMEVEGRILERQLCGASIVPIQPRPSSRGGFHA